MRLLLCVTLVSIPASSQSDDNLFLASEGLDSGDSQYLSSTDGFGGGPDFLFNGDSSSPFPLNAGFDSSNPFSQDGDLTMFFDGNPSSVASSNLFDDGFAPATNDLSLSSFSGDSKTLASDELLDIDASESDSFDVADCADDDEPTLGKSKRGGAICGAKHSFPPSYALPERFDNQPENDPKKRPTRDVPNVKSDFVNCPSGEGGYRMYWICDNGKPEDRIFVEGRETTLLNLLSPDRDCKFLFPLSRSLAQDH